jgi:hypothetical protein
MMDVLIIRHLTLISALISGIFGTTNGFSWISFIKGFCALYFFGRPLWALFCLLKRNLNRILLFIRNKLCCCFFPTIVDHSSTNQANDDSTLDQTESENDEAIAESNAESNSTDTDDEAPIESQVNANAEEEIVTNSRTATS